MDSEKKMLRRLRFLTNKIKPWKLKLREDDWYFISATKKEQKSVEYKNMIIKKEKLGESYIKECGHIIKEMNELAIELNKIY
jgi:hypothetical protein